MVDWLIDWTTAKLEQNDDILKLKSDWGEWEALMKRKFIAGTESSSTWTPAASTDAVLIRDAAV